MSVTEAPRAPFRPRPPSFTVRPVWMDMAIERPGRCRYHSLSQCRKPVSREAMADTETLQEDLFKEFYPD